jgi:hypothetical protein
MSLNDPANHGNHWEIVPGFIRNEAQLRAAARQAIWLCLGSEGQEVHPDGDLSVGVSVKKFAISRLQHIPQTRRLSELLQVVDRSQEAIGSSTDEAYFSIYNSLGSTGEQRDQLGEETLSVGLNGEAEARVQDPVSGGWSEFQLYPGDALHFNNNQAPVLERPLHVVRNRLITQRVALVINA